MGEEIRPYRDPLRGAVLPATSSEPLASTAPAAFDVSRVVERFLAEFRIGKS
jgi:hypothetical protein